MPILNQSMFREYDLRGHETADEMNDIAMYYIGKGFGTFLRQQGITKSVVGHDVRSTSESFHNQLIKGLNECGVDVTDIGEVTTPMGYWAQYYFNIKGLAIVTASHNPVGWNGAKLGSDLSRTLFGPEIQKIYQIIKDESFIKGSGETKKENILQAYIDDLLSKIHITKKFKILVNTGNGTAGIVASEILQRTGCEIIQHNIKIDPSYPNYTPNPENEAMMKDTAAQTIKNSCDFGLAFDGDGDRLGLVDEKGNVVLADKILILLSRLVLAKHPGAKIIFDVKVSESLPEDIKAHGGIPIMWKTGHSLIKAKMKEETAALAGEMSGHIFWSDGYYGFDDAVFSALKLLEYLSSEEISVSEIISSLPNYVSTPTINIQTSDETKKQVVAQLVKQFKDEGFKVIDIDGARVYNEDGWGLVRASNTTPTLVIRFESKTKEGLIRLESLFRQKLKQFPEVSSDWEETSH